ncbi:porin [Candidatus Nitrosacidococcus tergens]|uniref:Porin n=1 Tax=Candidatus Nitrosacidococcus tergens TaxID=553981 RepID=A0A7G1QAU8_9GAMM|nr:porin [Candidatus Nitrosacidococcus tergens]CAB1276805.1 conserved protein of unknown function [Candidatus Nitrosacidococcus tergens]
MDQLGFNVDGWVESGVVINPYLPKDGNNGPLTFNNRANVPVLDQFYLFIERVADVEGNQWSFGGRADFMFGVDAPFTQETGLDINIVDNNFSNFYKVALPQFYAEIFAPYGKGIDIKVGHFYTIIGHETVTSPNNFFYSHAYTMQYGEPFTHTGFIAESPITNNITIKSGGVLGWDNFSKDPQNFNYLGGISFISDDGRSTFDASVITGGVSKISGNMPNSDRTMYSLVFNYDITDRWHYTWQHDFGIQHNNTASDKVDKWYGMNQYLLYKFSETLGIGMRFEWFRDANGVRVFSNGLSAPADYFESTVGVNWKVTEWITFRPEVRTDWMYSNTGYKAFDDNTRSSRVIVAGEVIINF